MVADVLRALVPGLQSARRPISSRLMSRVTRAFGLLLSAVCCVAVPCSSFARLRPLENRTENRYVGRDGVREARAHLRAGRPVRLYTHLFNGFAPGYRTPGLIGCSPLQAPIAIFEFVRELNFQEGQLFRSTPDQLARMDAANRFPSAYNRETYRLRAEELQSSCPQVRLESMQSTGR